MNLLLLLSALLSAIGGTGGVRAAQAPVAFSRGVAQQVVRATATARAQRAARPAQSLPTPASAKVTMLPVLAVVPAVPAYATRRRE